jgi:hypothetical protein
MDVSGDVLRFYEDYSYSPNTKGVGSSETSVKFPTHYAVTSQKMAMFMEV